MVFLLHYIFVFLLFVSFVTAFLSICDNILIISFQEEERERRDNYVPEVSEIKTEHIQIDAMTFDMLKNLKFETKGLKVENKRRAGKTTRAKKE